MNLQIHGERCSRCIKSWRSDFARFFLFSFLLLFFLFLSTINRPFDFHGNERFPSKYRIDRRPTKREKEREREPIFSRGTMGTTSVTANGTFRVQTFRSFTSSTSTTTVKLPSYPRRPIFSA